MERKSFTLHDLFATAITILMSLAGVVHTKYVRNAGIDISQKRSKEESQREARDAGRVIKIVFLITFALLIGYLLYILLREGN